MLKETREDLARYAGRSSKLQVTIHAAMERRDQAVRKNRTILNNAAREAERCLVLRGLGESEAEAFVQPVRDLATDSQRMNHQLGSLSLFIDDTDMEELQLPTPIAAAVEAGAYPDIAPLLEPMLVNREYFVLTLSRGGVGLYRCTRYQASLVELPGLPEDLLYVLRYDEFEKSLQQHMTSRGGETAMVHGHGTGKDEKEQFLLRFIDEVDAAVTGRVRSAQLPLVLMGNEDVVGRFRERSKLEDLIAAEHHVDPFTLRIDTLIERGWLSLDPVVREAHRSRVDRAASGRTVSGVHPVLAAITQGRAAAAYVDPSQVVRGSFDRESGEVHEVPADTRAVDNLTNIIAVEALRLHVPVEPCTSDELTLPAALLH